MMTKPNTREVTSSKFIKLLKPWLTVNGYQWRTEKSDCLIYISINDEWLGAYVSSCNGIVWVHRHLSPIISKFIDAHAELKTTIQKL